MQKINIKTVQTGERPQTNGWTHIHGRYRMYYRPCYAVDNELNVFCVHSTILQFLNVHTMVT